MRTKRISCSFLLLCAAFLSTGCASLFGSPMHNVRIDSAPQNAGFTVTDEQGDQVAQGVTPDTVVLRTSSAPFQAARYYVNFEHEAYPGKTNTLKGRISGWYYLNIIYNIVGALIIDPYTGAMYTLPSESRAVLTSETNSAGASENTAAENQLIPSLEPVQ